MLFTSSKSILSSHNKLVILLCLTFFSTLNTAIGQTRPVLSSHYDNVFWGNHHMNAIDASRFADGKRERNKKETPVFVGVAVHVEEDHKETPEAWGEFLAKMFEHYDIPVKIYLDENIDPGQNCVITIYINGFSYSGNMGNGTLSPKYLTENHAFVMREVKRLYDKANLI